MKTPFHVTAYPGSLLGKFVYSADALRVAQMWSARWGSWVEVRNVSKNAGGLIGQFDKGQLTPEFIHLKELVSA